MHLADDRVGLHVVEGTIAAFMADMHAALLDHALGGPMGFPFGLLVAVVVAPGQRQAVHLFDVKHVVDPHQRRTGLRVVLLAAGRLARVWGAGWPRRLLVVTRVNQDRRRLLAGADLTTQRLNLRGSRPAVIAVALRGVGDTQMQRGHAPVRVPAHEVFREPARAGRPRLLPRRHALRDLRRDGRDKRGVVVLQGPLGGCADGLRHQAISSRLSHGTAAAPGGLGMGSCRSVVIRAVEVQSAPIHGASTFSPCARNWPCGPTYR